jgi:mRNA interferase HigB
LEQIAERFSQLKTVSAVAYTSQNEISLRSVHVISRKALREFAKEHADATTPLSSWLKLMRRGRFRSFAELKRTFASADMVPVEGRDLYVFNIGGNKYRLIAAIHFNTQRVFVRHILKHPEYAAGRWKK